MNYDLLKDIFSYHAPTEEQKTVYNDINAMFFVVANGLNSMLPEGPGKTFAIRKLAEARMSANAAVALEGKF